MHPDWLSNAFAIADREGGTALFVDSGADVGPLVAAVEAWGATPAAVLRTHSHHDHVVHENELRADGEPVRPRLERRGARGLRAGAGRRPRRNARRLVARLRRQGQGLGPLR